MTRAEIQQRALELPAADRQELAEALWESLEAETVPIQDFQKRLLGEWLKALEEHPDEGSPWEDMEKRVWPDAG